MTKASIKLVTWDWNGTLLADTQICIDASNHVTKTFGGTPLPRRDYQREFYFPTLDFYCDRGCDREEMIKRGFASVFLEFYEERVERSHTRRGARDVLYHLNERLINSVILSNHLTEKIRPQLERLGLDDCIDEVMGNSDVGSISTGNNKIDRMVRYLAREEYDPAEAIIIGDSPEDVGIGKELGMRTIAITDGYSTIQKLRRSEPDYVIGSLPEVIGIIEKEYAPTKQREA